MLCIGKEELTINISEVDTLINDIVSWIEKRGFQPIVSRGLFFPLYNYLFTPSAGHHFIDPIIKTNNPQKLQTFSVLEMCIRELDFERIGITKKHLSLFEMFDFGYAGHDLEIPIKDGVDIFYSLLIDFLKLKKENFIITVFGGGNLEGQQIKPEHEFYNLWCKYFSKSQVFLLPGRTNFFYTRTTGCPGGPGVEIYYGNGKNRFIEIASQVNYKYLFEGTLKYKINHALAHGIGLERLLMVLENVPSIYDISLFSTIKRNLIEMLNLSSVYMLFEDTIDQIIDLTRCVVFIIAEGQTCDKSSRGKLLKKFIKKIATKINYFGITDLEYIFENLVRIVIESMSARFTDLKKKERDILQSIKEVIINESRSEIKID